MAVVTNNNNNNEKMSDKIIDDLAKLLERTGMDITQENGQRRLGPSKDHNGPPPPKGSEVFVGKIPRDCFEPELVEVFEKVGKIYELRLMMDFVGTNRGFCFIQFYTSSEAQRAIRELDNYEIRKGRFIGVVKSVDNCRLFVGGIPTDKLEKDIFDEINKVTEGVVRVIMYPSAADKAKNRGFSFVEYTSHKAAAMARRKMIPGKILMWGIEVAVDWAEPEPDVDAEIMNKVQILYVRNLMLTTTEGLLQELFNKNSSDGVEKVKKLKDFAFIHFTSREQAEKAKLALNDTDIDGSRVEITWAKPVDKNIYKTQKALSRTLYPPSGRNSRGGSTKNQSSSGGTNQSQHVSGGYLGSYTSHGGHGLIPIPTNFQNGHAMSPMTPYHYYSGNFDANIRTQRILAARFSRGRAAAGIQGIRLPTGAQSIQALHNPTRNMLHYGTPMYSDQYYYAYHHPQQYQSPSVLATGGVVKKSPQDLLELCLRNGWTEPIYTPNTYNDDVHNIYYVFTITIRNGPLIIKEYRGEHYCQDIEEARAHAADGMYRSLQNEMNTYANQGISALSTPHKYYAAFAV